MLENYNRGMLENYKLKVTLPQWAPRRSPIKVLVLANDDPKFGLTAQ
jgi:hypothetical protein